ncbi:MAG: molybdopterin oxidoreductase family protein, partial [Chloroflexota bacterium]
PDNTNEDNYVLQQFTRAVMGSNSINRLMTGAQAGVEDALAQSFGVGASPAGMQEMMTDANSVLVIGPDIAKVSPVASYWLYWALRYREATMIVMSEEHTPLAERSNHWLNVPAGVEADVINAMARIIADAGLSDPDVDHSWIPEMDIDSVCDSAGLDRDALQEAAILYATGGQGIQAERDTYPASAIWYSFADQDNHPSQKASLAAHNLAQLCGNIGEPGGGVLAIRKSANMQGSLDVGCDPNYLPGGSPVTDEGARAALEESWSARWAEPAITQNGFVQLRELPTEPGAELTSLVDAIENGEITAMYVAAQSHHRGEDKDQFFTARGEGYFTGRPSSIFKPRYDTALVEALGKLELLIVEDCFESELTEIADVVLPTALYLEKDGTFTNFDRTVQRVRFAVPAPGEARSTYMHVAAIAERLGYRIDATNPGMIFEEIASFTPWYSGISYPRLERGGMQAPVESFGARQSIRLAPGEGLVPDEVQIVAG